MSDGRGVALHQQGSTDISMERGMKTMNWVQGFFVHKRIISAVKRVEFVSYRISYIVLRGHWFHIIILNVHAPTEDKIDDLKDSFYEELERIFDKFPKYHMKILLGDFNAKVGREDIFKPLIGNKNLPEISNNNGVRVVNFATSKNLIVKSMVFPHCNIHKCTLTSPNGKIHNDIDNILIDRQRHQVYLMSDHSGQQIVIWEVEINTIWETRENIKISAKESLG
jgi:hypothetical protein